ncbi:MAG: hypothetical protein QNJ13_05605 [Paracoccaceae bacterium]|nr:hypothetical protein [Paracoccaceae bacterium]
MAREVRPLFLARQSYRRRRLMDIARLMPFLGAFGFLLPVLWAGSARTSSGMIYLFAVWGLLILGLALMAGPISRAEAEPDESGRDGHEETEEP